MRTLRGRGFTLLIVGVVCALPIAFQGAHRAHPTSARATAQAVVRVDQVGYRPGDTKQVVVMATVPETGASVRVVDVSTGAVLLTVPIGPSTGAWSSVFPYTYRVDLTALATLGHYVVQISGPQPALSPVFAVAPGRTLYSPLLAHTLFFFQAQRDGAVVDPQVMNRQPSHLTDRTATIYRTPVYRNDVLQGTLQPDGGPVDVSGGWFDAGDYLKFVETTSYVDAVALFAVRQYPALLGSGATAFSPEARFGLDWLQKMWNPAQGRLYYQVGIGDGNGSTILGDHDLWRLPQVDDTRPVTPGSPAYYVTDRPVFAAGPAGTPLSPNLAGRLAAAFALCFQVYHANDAPYAATCLSGAEKAFDQAQTTGITTLLTAAPHDYYPETEWRDDLELGATELYLATALGGLPSGLPHTDPLYYLRRAAYWANAYISGPTDGADSLNLYDVSGLAHYDLYRAIAQAGYPSGLAVTPAALLADLRLQLNNGMAQAASDPFRLGVSYGTGGDTTPHALGYAVEVALYHGLTGATTYDSFGRAESDWVLGANAWGTSFIVGAGTSFPHCMQHQVANLSGSLDGTPPIVLGATVDGPNATSAFSGVGTPGGARSCPANGGDPFRPYAGRGARYWDNVAAWPSVEPADDYTVIGLLAFAQLAAQS